ncbi:MAG: TIGR00725 family protein [bacterium]
MIGVIGSGDPSMSNHSDAYDVGRMIAEGGAVLVCGGLSGVMEAASRGAYEIGGTTIGILPGDDRHQANPYISIPIPSGMGVGRNVLIVRSSDTLIALPGGSGTLSEIAISLNIGKPVIDLGRWGIEGTISASDPEGAVKLALSGI